MNSCASSRGMPARDDEPEVAHAVGEPEVDHLGHRALVRGDVVGCLVEHARGRLAVDVGAAREGLLQVLVARHVGEDPQLDLRVVGGEQASVRGARDEGPPDPPPELGPDRDVLEVRIARRQPSGRRDGLVERRVQPAVGGDAGAAAPRRRSSGASCRPATRAACRSSGGPAAGPRAPTRRSSSRSSSACPSAGSSSKNRTCSSCLGLPRLNSWPTST